MVVFVVVLLGVPLGILGNRLVREEAQLRLEQAAQRVSVEVEDRFMHGEPLRADRLRRFAPPARQVVVVGADGARFVVGADVPPPRTIARAPVTGGGQVTVLASSRTLDDRTARGWGVVAALSVLSIAVAVALAVAQARRLGRPLEELAGSAERLGAGDTRPTGRRYGVPEIDRVAEVLDRSAERLGELLRREREFTTDASHQLRTPLTALSIRLEEIAAETDSADVRDEAEAGLAQVERLAGVVDALLARARNNRVGAAVPFEVGTLLTEQAREWAPAYRRAGRELVVAAPAGLSVAGTPGTVGQVIADLLDNALAHGAGTVRLRARPASEYVVVEVSDEGAGVPAELVPRIFERSVSGGSGTGLGLALARELVEADGGRLELVRARPPMFAAFLPVAAPASAADTRASDFRASDSRASDSHASD